MPRLKVISTILQRAERYNDESVCYYGSAMYVFSMNINYGFNKLESLLDELISEQEGRWGNLVELPDTRKAYSLQVNNYYKAMINAYSPAPYSSKNWHPPISENKAKNYVISDHPFSVFVICGLTGRCNAPLSKILNELGIESPCIGQAGQLYPCQNSNLHIDMQSVYTFLTYKRLPRIRLRKCGGWLGVTIFKNQAPEPRPYKKTVTITTTTKQNPLSNTDIDEFYPPLRLTLEFCKTNALNPIPLQKGSKQPFRSWKYLLSEPIRPSDLSLFKSDINIGIISGYNRLGVLDIDGYPPLNLPTSTVQSPNGYHYYFHILDYETHKVFCSIPGRHKEIVLKSRGYNLAPGSISPDGAYRWINLAPPMQIKSSELIALIHQKIKEAGISCGGNKNE